MRKNKKIVILTGVFLMTLNFVACGQIKEDEFVINQPGGDMQTVESTDSGIKGDDIVITEESSANQQENSAQTVEIINPETFPVGEYHDDMDSQLIISKVDDKNYTVEFGIYKSMYTENAVGSYDVNTGILSFSGTDISTESTISADVAIQGDNLLVTLTHSEYLTGETFEFEPSQP